LVLRLPIAVGIAALLALTSAAAAVTEDDARGLCWRGPGHGETFRLGPLTWLGDLDTYEGWDGVSDIDEDGTYYAKKPMWVRRGVVVSIAVARRQRKVADILYGGPPATDVKRLHSCERRTAFFSGGFLVTEPVCLKLAVRVRGSRRVYRETASIGKGAAC
jgi:hypothetical protein